MNSSSDSWLRGVDRDALGDRAGDDDHAFRVTDQDIAGQDQDAGAADRHVEVDRGGGP
jgi:hypothetical protein